MKYSVLIALAFSAQSYASEMTCMGHEIMPGDAGRHGTIVLGADPFSVQWNGDSKALAGQGVLCGVSLAPTVQCEVKDQSSGPTISARFLCVDTAKGAFNNQIGEGYYVFSTANGVGRFGCSNTSGAEKVSKLVEINNCK